MALLSVDLGYEEDGDFGEAENVVFDAFAQADPNGPQMSVTDVRDDPLVLKRGQQLGNDPFMLVRNVAPRRIRGRLDYFRIRYTAERSASGQASSNPINLRPKITSRGRFERRPWFVSSKGIATVNTAGDPFTDITKPVGLREFTIERNVATNIATGAYPDWIHASVGKVNSLPVTIRGFPMEPRSLQVIDTEVQDFETAVTATPISTVAFYPVRIRLLWDPWGYYTVRLNKGWHARVYYTEEDVGEDGPKLIETNDPTVADENRKVVVQLGGQKAKEPQFLDAFGRQAADIATVNVATASTIVRNTTLTLPGAGLDQSYVGATVFVAGAGADGNSPLVTSITAVNSATSVTMGSIAFNTLASTQAVVIGAVRSRTFAMEDEFDLNLLPIHP